MKLIPKVIHYCWFGGNPLPELALKCIESWQKYCPGWTINEWNESNFDIGMNTYVKEAYQAKKWAFVSDVARLWVLVTYGGVYMDTDCELVRSIDEFLVHEAVSGFESPTKIPTALMGCQAGHRLFKQLLLEYDSRCFMMPDGSYDMTTNVISITNTLLKHGLILNNTLQTVCDFTLYPTKYFCPKDLTSGKIVFTKYTHAIHHFDASWLDNQQHKEREFRQLLKSRFGRVLGEKIYVLWFTYTTVGFRGVLNKIIVKFGIYR